MRMPPALVQLVIDTTPAGHPIVYDGPEGSGTIQTAPPSVERMGRAVRWVSERFLGRFGVNAVGDRWDPPRVEVRTTGDALALATMLPAKVDGIAVSVYRGSEIRPFWGSKPDPFSARRPPDSRATMLGMYAPVSAMRSTRYPLAGLGCGCSPTTAGLGQILAAGAGFAIAGAGAVGLIAGYFLGKYAQRAGLALNRRRRRR